MLNEIGIYAIENICTNWTYVGATKHGFLKRWEGHRNQLKIGWHPNGRLQQDWNDLGVGWFKFVVLEEVPRGNPTAALEQHWINRFKAEGRHCYNVMRAREILPPGTKQYIQLLDDEICVQSNGWILALLSLVETHNTRTGLGGV